MIMKNTLFLLLLLAFAMQLQAQSFVIGDLTYNINKDQNTVEVARSTTKISDNYITSITIPETVDKDGKSYPVTSIGESAFSNCYMLSTVIIPNSIKSIDKYAFSGCSGLRQLVIPSSVTSIGVAAFFNCKNLKYIEIPNSVKSIGNGAFNNENTIFFCEIASKPMGWTVGTNEHWNNKKGSVNWDSFIEGESGFQRISSNEVYYLKTMGFADSIDIPSSVTHLGVTYQVKGIGNNAFADNVDISAIGIPDQVTYIGKSAFSGCSELTSITIPNSVTTIGDNAFSGCTSLISIIIPNSVKTIGNSAFSSCASLRSITISNSVTIIGKNTFSECISLASATIPNSVTDISDNAFSGCTDLNQVTLSNSAKNIGKNAFAGCVGLRSVIIPHSVKSIGSYAFSNCEKLSTVFIPNTVTTIGNNAFDNISTEFYCEHSGKPENWSGDVTRPNKYWNNNKGRIHWEISFIEDSILYYITSAYTVSVRGCLNGGPSLKIPSQVNYNGTKYTVTDIGRYAFSNNLKLSAIAIPESVASIGENAFSGCDNIKAIYCEVTAKPKGWADNCFTNLEVVTWGKDAFSNFVK